MELHDFGEWIRVEYWNGEVEYVKSLPEDTHNLYSITYISNGLFHNENGPAYLYYYQSGGVEYKEYYLNDHVHREDGPAFIWYNKDGSVDAVSYYLNSEYLFKEEWEKEVGIA